MQDSTHLFSTTVRGATNLFFHVNDFFPMPMVAIFGAMNKVVAISFQKGIDDVSIEELVEKVANIYIYITFE